jgi:hypothetical protein
MHRDSSHWYETMAPRDGGLLRLRQRWQQLCTGNTVPLTTRYDPQDVPDLLPWTMLVDVENAPNAYRPFDLRSRFIGSAVGQYFGADGDQHITMSEIGSPFAERWFSVVDRVLTTQGCCCFDGAPYRTGFDFMHCELLVLPFSTDGAAIDSLLAAFAVSMRGRTF